MMLAEMHPMKLKLALAMLSCQMHPNELLKSLEFFGLSTTLLQDRKLHQNLVVYCLGKLQQKEPKAASFLFLLWMQMDFLSCYYTYEEQEEIFYHYLAYG